MRKLMGWVAALGMMAMPACAQDTIGPFSAGPDVLAYAVTNACLPYLRDGVTVDVSLKGKGAPGVLNGRPQFLMRGLGEVSVETLPNGQCYVAARRGNGADFRDAVFKALTQKGLHVEAFADYDSHMQDRHWGYVQEVHCFRMDDQVYEFLMSSEADGKGMPMQLTFLKDGDGAAAKKGLCQA